MKTVLKIPIVAVAVVLVFVLWNCSHTKKETVETAEVPEEGAVSVEVDEGMLEEFPVKVENRPSNIYFDFDSAVLQVQAREELQRIAAWLSRNPDTKIRIEGNCDERGTEEYNLTLGERRAVAAKNYLVSLGISPKNLVTISFGEENPADPGHNEAAWEKNRRDEFNIVEITSSN
jgi:peptidoglycan-associated lipoprotein